MKSRFRPCIDLHAGKVKQIVGGTLRDRGDAPKENFVSAESPAYYARLYRRDNLTGGHVICLGPGNEDAAREALAAWQGGLQVGGGVTDANASRWLDAGAAKVIVTSFVFADGVIKMENLKRLARSVPREKLVLDLSCRAFDGRYHVMTDRWQKRSETVLNRDLFAFLSEYAGEFLVHAVAVEGLRGGIDETLTENLTEWAKGIPCVYAGGISSLADVEKINRISGGAVDYTVGSALDIFGGNLSYETLVDFSRS